MEQEIEQWEAGVRHVCYQPMLIDGVPYIKQIKREIKRSQDPSYRQRDKTAAN
jgi:hypothetical protein